MNSNDIHYTFQSRTLRCAHCRSIVGNAHVQHGKLLVADESGAALTPTRTTEASARALYRHLAQAAQEEALSGDTASNAFRGSERLAEIDDARLSALREVDRLGSGASDVTYTFDCGRGHTPRIMADRLAELVRGAPGRDLELP